MNDRKHWKTKPVAVFDDALMNEVFIEKIEKFYQIHCKFKNGNMNDFRLCLFE